MVMGSAEGYMSVQRSFLILYIQLPVPYPLRTITPLAMSYAIAEQDTIEYGQYFWSHSPELDLYVPVVDPGNHGRFFVALMSLGSI